MEAQIFDNYGAHVSSYKPRQSKKNIITPVENKYTGFREIGR